MTVPSGGQRGPANRRSSAPGAGGRSRAILALCPLFAGLSADRIEAIARQASERRVPRGGMYFQQGDRPTHVYVHTQGRVALVRREPDGHEIIVGFAAPGQPFGYVAVMSEAPYSAAAQAIEASAALAWDAESMNAIMLAHPRVALNCCRLAARQVTYGWDRLLTTISGPMERRVARALLHFAAVQGVGLGTARAAELVISHEEVAELVGTTVYTVSRILSRWKRRGLVQLRRGRVVIARVMSLLEIAGGSVTA